MLKYDIFVLNYLFMAKHSGIVRSWANDTNSNTLHIGQVATATLPHCVSKNVPDDKTVWWILIPERRGVKVPGIGWVGTLTRFSRVDSLSMDKVHQVPTVCSAHQTQWRAKGGDSGEGQLVGTNQARRAGWAHIVQSMFTKKHCSPKNDSYKSRE